MKINRLVLPLLFMVSVAALTGCPSINRDYPVRRFYQFELATPTKTEIPINGSIVQLREFNISPGSRGTEFIYRIGEFEYKSDFYNQFFRSPAPLISQASARYLEQTGVFEDVISTMDEATPDFSVEGSVNRLFGDFRDTGAPKAVLEIQLFLLDNSNIANPVIIFGRIYNRELPIGSRSPEELMNGWNKALEQILEEFRSDARSEISGYSRPAAN